MNKHILGLVLLFLISCSRNDDEPINNQQNIETDNLTIRYKGYYQEFFGESYQNDIYTNITVTPIEEQISPTETLSLLKISAFSSGKTEDIIIFYIYPNTTGKEALYNNSFSFRSHGATYHPSILNFEVLTNNDSEFSAEFFGKLEHWYEGELRYVYLNISYATIFISR